MKRILLLITAGIFVLISCGEKETNGDDIINIENIKDIALDNKRQLCEVKVSANIEEHVKIETDGNFIESVSVDNDVIKLTVSENLESYGYRTGVVRIMQNDKVIKSFKVYQSINPVSKSKFAWAKTDAPCFNSVLIPENIKSGLEATKYVYNLSKTTNGKDNYKNYPAFAFCIDMNHDPENNMEYYLPTHNDLIIGDEFLYIYRSLPTIPRPYIWTSKDNDIRAGTLILSDNNYQFSYTNHEKIKQYYVIAFKK